MLIKNIQDLETILLTLKKILCSRSIYVFGAGASALYIPINYDHYETARNKILEFSSFPIEERKPNQEQLFRLQISGSPFIYTKAGKYSFSREGMDFIDRILHLHPELVYCLSVLNYSIDEEKVNYCPEYEFFNLANIKSKFITLNHDKLAKKFINNRVLALHGEITQNHRDIINKYLPLAMDIDLTKSLNSDLHMIKKEDESILKSTEYATLQSCLNSNKKYKHICIIGYSFFKKNNYEVYDTITYALLKDYAKEQQSQITIIDKNPYFVADIISNNLKINCFEIDWSAFAYTFYEIWKLNIILKQNKLDLKKFLILYNFFIEEQTRTYNHLIVFKKKSLSL